MSNQRKRVQTNGAEFVVTDQGDEHATAVLLLHGFPTSASMWSKQVRACASRSDCLTNVFGVANHPARLRVYNER